MTSFEKILTSARAMHWITRSSPQATTTSNGPPSASALSPHLCSNTVADPASPSGTAFDIPSPRGLIWLDMYCASCLPSDSHPLHVQKIGGIMSQAEKLPSRLLECCSFPLCLELFTEVASAQALLCCVPWQVSFWCIVCNEKTRQACAADRSAHFSPAVWAAKATDFTEHGKPPTMRFALSIHARLCAVQLKHCVHDCL